MSFVCWVIDNNNISTQIHSYTNDKVNAGKLPYRIWGRDDDCHFKKPHVNLPILVKMFRTNRTLCTSNISIFHKHFHHPRP